MVGLELTLSHSTISNKKSFIIFYYVLLRFRPGDATERTLFPFFADIPHIAPFVRFDSVKVDLVSGLEESRWPRANEPHHVFLPLFRALKQAISGCKLFLRADIEDIDFDFNGSQKDWYGKQFASGQTLLTYLSGQLFPMFGLNGYCRECDVQVRFFTDKSAANHFVDRFFQLPTILYCSHLLFSLDMSWYIEAGETFELPIKSIVNWLFPGACHGNDILHFNRCFTFITPHRHVATACRMI